MPCRRWLYRIRPSVKHNPYQEEEAGYQTNDFSNTPVTPQQVQFYFPGNVEQ